MLKNSPASMFLFVLAASVATGVSSSSLAFDEAAAKATFKENDCTKCHAPKKTKKGPSLEKIAAKYKEKGNVADAETKIIKHLSTNPNVKLEDGTEQEHKSFETKDQAQIKNTIQWILSH